MSGILSPFGGEGLSKLAGTPEAAGFPLQDATPTVVSWTAPDDGNAHRVLMFAMLSVSSDLTGGGVNCEFYAPDGTQFNDGVFGTDLSAGLYSPINDDWFFEQFFVQAGSEVLIYQYSAVTGGAAIIWAELWGS